MAYTGSTPWQTDPQPVPYPDAITAMQARVADIRAGRAGGLVWLLEHPALYTAGTSARPEDLARPDVLPVFHAGRGGQWTYHGPGQRVAYIMLDLDRPHGLVPPRDLHAYVDALEAWLIAALAEFGVSGMRRRGRVGVWVAGAGGTENKIAAVGVRITRWVSWHGVSLNVAPELAHFAGIVPCGIREHGVTSLRDVGVQATMAEVDGALWRCWQPIFGRSQPAAASAMKRPAAATS